MPLVPAICTQCGATIEVDNSQEAAVCKYCGTPFIVEKAIHQYTTNVTNHNNFAGANVQINMNVELEQLIAAAEGFERLGELLQASKKYTEVTEKYPQDVRGWLGKLRTDDLGYFFRAELVGNDDAHHDKWFWYGDTVDFKRTKFAHVYQNAYLLADAATKSKLEEAKENYVNAIKRDIEKARKEVSLDTLKASIGEGDFYYRYDIYGSTSTYPRIHMFNRDEKLYYQYVDLQPIEDSTLKRTDVKTYEIVAIDENGVMYGKHRLGFYPDIQVQLYNTDYMYPNCERISCKSSNDRYLTCLNRSGSSKNNSVLDNNLRIEQKYVDAGKQKLQKANKKGCYIATCVYGSYDCPQVWTLRRFRDDILDTTWHGKAFIKCYYAMSPTLVKLFGNQKWFKTFWKNRLDTMISHLNRKGIENTRYNDKY